MIIRRLFNSSKEVYFKFESQVLYTFFGTPPPQCYSFDITNESSIFQKPILPSINDVFENAFLFAVPKTRRSVQKRRNRKFGIPGLHWKPLVPKNNILMCDECGNDYEAGHLCGHCYNRIQTETELMQKAIEAELKLDPIDKEVTILYEGEATEKPEHFWKGKRIVELKKPRPSWFSKNLLQKSTADSSTDSETKKVKPDLA